MRQFEKLDIFIRFVDLRPRQWGRISDDAQKLKLTGENNRK